ncbi:MAG: hypothetical protein MSK40_04315 [Parabacteroides sp.]|nr:hypothetical protein [Parabacteroides sp.]
MIWSLAQSTGLSIEDILYKWSFENVLLFSRATPSYDTGEKEEDSKPKFIEALDMNNPDNIRINPNSENDDEEYIV